MCISLIRVAVSLVVKSDMGRGKKSKQTNKKTQSCCELIINTAILFDIFFKPIVVGLCCVALWKGGGSSSLHVLAEGTRERCDLTQQPGKGRLSSQHNLQNPSSIPLRAALWKCCFCLTVSIAAAFSNLEILWEGKKIKIKRKWGACKINILRFEASKVNCVRWFSVIHQIMWIGKE